VLTGRRPLRLGRHLAFWLVASLAYAQAPAEDLTGTYALDTPRGAIIVRIEVVGGQLVGTLDSPGSRRIVLSGTARGPYARGTYWCPTCQPARSSAEGATTTSTSAL